MSAIRKRTTGDLLCLLQRQHPSSATTFSPCPLCSAESRGGGYCQKCISAELKRRGIDALKVALLDGLLRWRSCLDGRIAAAVEAIQEDAVKTQCDERAGATAPAC